MRKIEIDMMRAICDCKNWSNANTAVVIGSTPEGNKRAEVLLHGNNIASVIYDKEIGTAEFLLNRETLRRWPTVTTKSRLRAMRFNIETRKGETFVDGIPL